MHPRLRFDIRAWVREALSLQGVRADDGRRTRPLPARLINGQVVGHAQQPGREPAALNGTGGDVGVIRIIGEGEPAEANDAVLFGVGDEPVQVRAGPAHGDVQGVVQLSDGAVAADE